MASVTGLTAARMLAIEAASIVSGAVDGSGNLILTKQGGGTVNAGAVVGPSASIGPSVPSNPKVGQIWYDTNNLSGLTDLMAAKNPVTSVANWTAYGFGYDTGVTFAVAGGGVTCTWTTTGNHFAGIPLTVTQGEQYLIKARVRVPVGNPDVQLTIGYKTSSQKCTIKGVDVTLVLAYTADSTSLSIGIECGGATGSVIVKELSVYNVNQRGFPEYIWDGTSWVQTEHSAQKADIYSRVNTYGDQNVDGLKTFLKNLTAKGFILSVGDAGTTADAATLILNGADAGAGGGGGEVRFSKNGSNKWSLYTLGSGDGNLYVRDQANAKMVATFSPGASGASALTVTDLLSTDYLRYKRSMDISGTDLNSLVNAGFYNGNSLTNAPDANWWYVEVLMHTNFSGATPTYMVQRATSLTNGTPVVYQRAMLGAGSWTAWSRIDYAVTPWTDVVFQNGWVNYGTPYQNVQYRKMGDEVVLRGLMKSGTLTVAAFTLPVGYRPVNILIFSGNTTALASWNTGAASTGTAHTHANTGPGSVNGRIDVQNDGIVMVRQGNNGWISVDGIRFSTV